MPCPKNFFIIDVRSGQICEWTGCVLIRLKYTKELSAKQISHGSQFLRALSTGGFWVGESFIRIIQNPNGRYPLRAAMSHFEFGDLPPVPAYAWASH